MTSIEQLRRDAKSLRKAFEAGEIRARQRVEMVLAGRDHSAMKHADFLHVIAQENGFQSWPRLAWAHETIGLDRAGKLQRLKVALAHGQNWRVETLLAETPDLAEGSFGLACALYDLSEVEAMLAEDPGRATRLAGPRRPILHLAFSKWIHARPDLEADMLAIAEHLVAHGADVNDGYRLSEGDDHPLSALYGAIGHANNMALGAWLLEQGADPNDNESLYHATELGHHEGLRLLLKHGADPKGTNALLRAMDFGDVEAVRMLLEAGADPDDHNPGPVGGEFPVVLPAMHQAARRMCSREIVELLLDHGAATDRVHEGMSSYALARAFGNREVAEALAARDVDTSLSEVEQVLADVADGTLAEGIYIDPAKLPEAAANIVRVIVHLPGKLDHLKRLVEAGAPFDVPDGSGVTPVQIAGWEGLPEVMGYLLSQRPDLSHVNNYGGTLLSTIIHGSENNPDREGRDYIGCLTLALKAGVALPRRVVEFTGMPEVAAFLEDWAEAHPGQVVDQGVA